MVKIKENEVEIGQVYQTPNGNRFLRVSDEHSVWVGEDNGRPQFLTQTTRTVVPVGDICEVQVVGEITYYY